MDSGEESPREIDLTTSPIIKQKKKNALGELEPQSTAEELDGHCLRCKFPINSFEKLRHTSICESKDLTDHPSKLTWCNAYFILFFSLVNRSNYCIVDCKFISANRMDSGGLGIKYDILWKICRLTYGIWLHDDVALPLYQSYLHSYGLKCNTYPIHIAR